jgi:hypothetical protein
MDNTEQKILVGDTCLKDFPKTAAGKIVKLLGDTYYQIENYDALPPFFMSLVSSSDHWLYISSSGGLSAGRISAEHALFPYYTEDKLTENSENTGGKTILLVTRGSRTWLWEPFSNRQLGQYQVERNLYKDLLGTSLVFEEVNHTLGLVFRYAWRTSEKWGFVKTAWLSRPLSDLEESAGPCQIELLDGVQNLLPPNVSAFTQQIFSCLLDAYKRSELEPETGLGLFYLNSVMADLPEPRESLLATSVFQTGLEAVGSLLSSTQLDRFRLGLGVTSESEMRGCRGAYFVHARLQLSPGQEQKWHIASDLDQDHAALVEKIRVLRGRPAGLYQEIESDIIKNAVQLRRIVSSADGWQVSADRLAAAHHFANVLFNVMRGGVFADQYWVNRADFTDYVSLHSRQSAQEHAAFFAELPERILASDLCELVRKAADADLLRLTCTYLPLTFSRRHGDPSRPWNRFAINIKHANGDQRLDYEGNWRDIFQNWEALAYAYPEYVENMISTFLCATTPDGYNPYRITRAGIDWELPEEGNPWANIGYWSDHQIIYLQKLMEISVKVHPGRLLRSLEQRNLSYANVPYRIRPYADLQKDPYSTIDFDHELHRKIVALVKELGSDGKLVCGSDGKVLHASLAEKLLSLLLAKLVNFVPEGGIWMNTQRPEWNDANNALVGKGLSVVTLGYMRRFVVFCRDLLLQWSAQSLQISAEMAALFRQVESILEQFQPVLSGAFDNEQRRQMMDGLGQAGSDFRGNLYTAGFSGEQSHLSRAELLAFLELTLQYIEHSLRANRRSDHLYHAYNILHLRQGRAEIANLYEMLEGQVSILSSGLLTGNESLALLESLRRSALYRPDQHSYILYPDRPLPGFMEKNYLPHERLSGLRLPASLAQAEDTSLLVQDAEGVYHFSGSLQNARCVRRALSTLAQQPQFTDLVEQEGKQILDLFEETFRHSEFTGRSGTFFAYEGLGSIYWHMISKLLLAVQETALRCQGEPVFAQLAEKYRDIRAGLGTHKSPAVYGAFPTDPYSHTPKGQGARQPGMTGMVKEEILTRLAEVGVYFENGCLVFNDALFDRQELLEEPGLFEYHDVSGSLQQIEVPPGSLAAAVCQVPVIVQGGPEPLITIFKSSGGLQVISGCCLDAENSRHIFQRDGCLHHLVVQLPL